MPKTIRITRELAVSQTCVQFEEQAVVKAILAILDDYYFAVLNVEKLAYRLKWHAGVNRAVFQQLADNARLSGHPIVADLQAILKSGEGDYLFAVLRAENLEDLSRPNKQKSTTTPEEEDELCTQQ